jgi:hypothetical protein
MLDKPLEDKDFAFCQRLHLVTEWSALGVARGMGHGCSHSTTSRVGHVTQTIHWQQRVRAKKRNISITLGELAQLQVGVMC